MKKNICKILFTIVCMFMTVGNVFALTLGNGINASVGRDYGDYSDVPIANSGESSKNFAVGIRFSLVTAEGYTVLSKDFYNTLPAAGESARHLSGTCNKLEYNRGTCSYGNNWEKISGYSYTTTLDQIFRNQGLVVNITSGLNSGNLSRDYMFGSLFSASYENQIKAAINSIMQNAGVNSNVENYRLPNGSYNLFIEWEPLGRIRIDSDEGVREHFYGTVYELSMLTNSLPGFNIGTTTCGGDSSFCNFGSSINKTLGCSVFLDSSNPMGAIVNDRIDPSKKGLFSTTSYFGGNLNLNSWSRSSCSTSGVKWMKDIAFSPSTTNGVGVIWITELFEGAGPTCDYIYEIYGNKKSINSPYYQLYLKKPAATTFNFSRVNNEIKQKYPDFTETIDTQWFKTYCPCEFPDCGPGTNTNNGGYNCKLGYNVPSCTNGSDKSVVYRDGSDTEEYWKNCVFTDEGYPGVKNVYDVSVHKWSNKSENLSYYDESLSSQKGYCDVYCIESVQGNFDSTNPEVLAGNKFVWGFSRVITTRTCRATNINFQKFQNDLAAANIQVANALAQNKLRDQNNNRGWDNGVAIYNGQGSGSCTNVATWSNGTVVSLQDNCASATAGLSNCSYTKQYSGNPPRNGTQNQPFSYNCSGTFSGNYLYTHDTSTNASVNVAGISGSASSDVKTKVASSKPNYNPVGGADVTVPINLVNSIIADFNKCFNFDNTNVLNEQSKATISYNSPNGTYNYSGDMEKTTSYNFNESTCTVTKPYTVLNNCNGNNYTCSNTTQQMYNCDTHKESGEAVTEFKLSSDTYRYVIKSPDGLTLRSVHSSEFESNYKNATEKNYKGTTVYEYNWTNTEYPNFPVPFLVDAKNYDGNLQINYSNLGHTTTPGSTDVDTILKTVTKKFGEYGHWSCGYSVKSNFIKIGDPDPLDIYIIYREIDLYDPFPNTDAKGRWTGANWCQTSTDNIIENCDNDKDNQVVNKYILQNRNVTGDDIYDLEPMYTFIMTPSDIIKIRRYNDKNTYSSYEGTLSGKKYTFTCTRGSLGNCRSDYLTQLLTDLDAVNLPGACRSDRQVYQGSTANSQFESCRYKGK